MQSECVSEAIIEWSYSVTRMEKHWNPKNYDYQLGEQNKNNRYISSILQHLYALLIDYFLIPPATPSSSSSSSAPPSAQPPSFLLLLRFPTFPVSTPSNPPTAPSPTNARYRFLQVLGPNLYLPPNLTISSLTLFHFIPPFPPPRSPSTALMRKPTSSGSHCGRRRRSHFGFVSVRSRPRSVLSASVRFRRVRIVL